MRQQQRRQQQQVVKTTRRRQGKCNAAVAAGARARVRAAAAVAAAAGAGEPLCESCRGRLGGGEKETGQLRPGAGAADGMFPAAKKKKKMRKDKKKFSVVSFSQRGATERRASPPSPPRPFLFPPASAGEWRPGRLGPSSLSAAAAGASALVLHFIQFYSTHVSRLRRVISFRTALLKPS